MTASLLAALLCAPASAAPAPAAAVQASSVAVSALGVSTLTVSSLYTGDRVRDPFQAGSASSGRKRDPSAPTVVDIHALQLRGILGDREGAFALFKSDDGSALVLRGGALFDESNKRVPGIRGRIQVKQKRAELITEDKDVQVFTLGETEDPDKAKP